jgi:hypothetical protein
MADKFVVVAGGGETTRANVEALLEDYFIADKRSYVLVLPFESKPSQGQIFAHQIASSMNYPTVVYSLESANISQLGGSSQTVTKDPYEECLADLSGEDLEAMVLYSEDCQEAAQFLTKCYEHKVPALDLCLGLAPIGEYEAKKPSEGPTRVVEAVKTPNPVPTLEFASKPASSDQIRAIVREVIAELKEQGLLNG